MYLLVYRIVYLVHHTEYIANLVKNNNYNLPIWHYKANERRALQGTMGSP